MIQRVVRFLDGIINGCIVVICVILLLFGGYGMWDSMQIQKEADTKKFEPYKPTKEAPTLEELQAINPEVFGWITVENTKIDYPIVQGEDNSKYVNTDIFGEFSLSGSLFLDARNQKDFSDFNSVIYGHHMEKNAMFGELVRFGEKDYFLDHPCGKVFFDGAWHKLEFYAFLSVDAYDPVMYDTGIMDEKGKEAYMSYVKEHATQWRRLSWKMTDRHLVLSTCTSASTNGRNLLVGRIVEIDENKERGEGNDA